MSKGTARAQGRIPRVQEETAHLFPGPETCPPLPHTPAPREVLERGLGQAKEAFTSSRGEIAGRVEIAAAKRGAGEGETVCDAWTRLGHMGH